MKKVCLLVLALVLALTVSLACAEDFRMGIDAEYPPSATWMKTAITPDSMWKCARRCATCTAGTWRSFP